MRTGIVMKGLCPTKGAVPIEAAPEYSKGRC
nr:MAG TPA: hypothetical protein [Caudoviricetes sp.]